MNLFRYSKPIIRQFEFLSETSPGDMPILWDAYKTGVLDVPEGLDIDQFIEGIGKLSEEIEEVWIAEDYINGKLEAVGIVLCNNDGWQLQPHVIYFDNATPKAKLRTYFAFMKHTKYRKDIGACVVRAEKHETALPNKVQDMGLLEYVGKVWGGRASGNEYLYSVRCGRRVN